MFCGQMNRTGKGMRKRARAWQQCTSHWRQVRSRIGGLTRRQSRRGWFTCWRGRASQREASYLLALVPFQRDLLAGTPRVEEGNEGSQGYGEPEHSERDLLCLPDR